MPEKDVIIAESKVKYIGVFDLLLLYKKLQRWIKERRFAEVKEVKYVERIKPFGKILDLVWETSRSEVGEYLSLELEVKILAVGINDVEVDTPSGKLKLNKAELEITFSSALVRNNKKEWADTSLLKRIYEKYIIVNQIEHFKIELYKDTEKLVDETKNFLALYRFK